MRKVQGMLPSPSARGSAFSEGARYERKTILAKIRREWKRCQTGETFPGRVLQQLEGWILDRRNRYESKPGGLGKR